jgi:hypothetical protein
MLILAASDFDPDSNPVPIKVYCLWFIVDFFQHLLTLTIDEIVWAVPAENDVQVKI